MTINKILLIIIGILTVSQAASGFWIKNLRSDLKETKLSLEQEVAKNAQCEKDKTLSMEKADEYQGKITTLNSRVAGLKRMYDSAKCIPIPASPSSQPNGTSGTGEPSGPRGVLASGLIDLGAEGEKYRLQVIDLQNFIRATWSSRLQ